MGVDYNPSITLSGLVMYFDPANLKSYPGSGTTISDLSGNSVVGTISGSPSFSTLAKGEFNFDGVNNKAIVTNLTLNYHSYITVSAWVKVNSGATGGYIINKNSYFASATTDFPLAMALSPTHIYCVVSDGTSFSVTTPVNGVQVSIPGSYGNVWSHISMTFGNNQFFLYYNGNVIYSTSCSFTLSTNAREWTIGRPAFENGGGVGLERFDGAISQVLIYNRDLSSTEILRNFNATRGRYGV